MEKSNNLIIVKDLRFSHDSRRHIPEKGIFFNPIILIKICLYETYRKVRVGKYLSDNFPAHSGLTQGDALSPLLFNFALEYAIRKVQKNQVGLKLNGTHLLLVYADNVNLVRDNIDIIKKNTQTLFNASEEVGLEINAEKTKYMLLSRHQNAGQNHDIKIANRSFKNAAQLKYFGTTVTYHAACIGEKGNAYGTLVRKPEEKRPLGRPRYRWDDNINMDLREIEWDSMGWTDLIQDRDQWRPLVNTSINLRVS
jgi:hypothetical protein